MVRVGIENPLLVAGDETALRNRDILIQNVSTLLAHIPTPTYWPLFFIDCINCQRLHFLDDPACVWRPARKNALA